MVISQKDNEINVYPFNQLNWSIIFKYHFGYLKPNMNQAEYKRYLGIESLKNKLNLKLSVEELTLSTKLDLSRNQLTQLPSEIGQLLLLQELDLSNNQLTQLSSEIGQLSSLQILDLDENQLTQLPSEIGQLSSLQELYLSRNQLTQLPSEIGQLRSLQELNLFENQLTQKQINELKKILPNTNIYT